LQFSKDLFTNIGQAYQEWETLNTRPPYGDEQDDYEWSKRGMTFAEEENNCPCPN
jgi:hypothetical protein